MVRASAAIVVAGLLPVLFPSCFGGDESSDPVCTPQEKQCEGNDIVKCNGDGSDWAFYKTCPDGCKNGVCEGEGGTEPPPDEDVTGEDDVPAVVVGTLSIKPDYALMPGDIFPTFLSHLFGGKTLPIDFATVLVQNTGGAMADVVVSAELVGYGEPSVSQKKINSGESVELKVNPSLDFGALFSINTPIPGNVKTVVKQGGKVVWEETKTVTLAAKNSMFWGVTEDGEFVDLQAFLCVFVTPHDKTKKVDKLLSAAADLMPGGSLGGYQETQAPPATYEIESATYLAEPLYLSTGNTISGVLTSVSGGNDADIDIYVMDQANLDTWMAGGQPMVYVQEPDSVTGTKFSWIADHDDVYYIIYLSPEDDWFDRAVTRARNASHHEIVTWHIAAIFYTLRDMGVSYVNTPADFFLAAQYIKYPGEMLADKSGNCVEGAVLFASAFEALGMQAHLALLPTHAFAAVELWEDEPVVIPIETTMVGGAEAAEDAIGLAFDEWDEAETAGVLVDLPVADCRMAGITPAPM
jgi:hypothetical protein